MPYAFDPEKFGFLPPRRTPKQIKDSIAKKSYVKVIATTEDGSFWFLACNKMPNQDRWEFVGGLYDNGKDYNQQTRPSTNYMGCITSVEFANLLLIHLLGTTTNDGTQKYGNERLLAPSLPIPRRKN